MRVQLYSDYTTITGCGGASTVVYIYIYIHMIKMGGWGSNKKAREG